jgi:hypothetical protein
MDQVVIQSVACQAAFKAVLFVCVCVCVCEADRLPPLNAEIKNGGFISPLPYTFYSIVLN